MYMIFYYSILSDSMQGILTSIDTKFAKLFLRHWGAVGCYFLKNML